MFKNDKHNRLKSDSIPKLFENKPPGGSIEVHDDNDLNKDCLPSCSISGMIYYKIFIQDICGYENFHNFNMCTYLFVFSVLYKNCN